MPRHLSVPTPTGTPLSPAALLRRAHRARPVLYIDRTIISDRYTAFRQALPQAAIHYAMKCNPHPGVLQHIASLGGSFEIASYAELALLDKLVDPQTVLFSNPVKSHADIRQALAGGVRKLAFQSQNELQKIIACVDAASIPRQAVCVYLRVAAPAGDNTIASEGKFGVPIATTSQQRQAAALLETAQALGMTPYGIAFHVGSQMENPDAWTAPLASIGRVMSILDKKGIRLNMLDLGGGFPAYHSTGIPPLKAFGTAISHALQALPYQPDLYTIEPGRALVSDAGALIAEIIGVDAHDGTPWLYLNVGAFNGLMEALESNTLLTFPIADELAAKQQTAYVLSGPSCDSQDTISKKQVLSAGLQTGHRLIIYTAGAYTTAYASHFNGFQPPTVILV